tara:strand:+ start:531 stop:1664 length:1134 start_codon:yes stop_codon:yes gene_type:complete
MPKQQILIQLSDDPFDTKKVEVDLPKDVKLLCNRPYALEHLEMYGLTIEQSEPAISDDNSYLTEGTVIGLSDDTALVQIDKKRTAAVQLSSESRSVIDQLEVDMAIDIHVRHTNKGDIIGSITEAIKIKTKQELFDSIGDKTVAFPGYVKELIHGGYWVNIAGIDCFMPGSVAGLNKLHDFESLVGREIYVMAINFSREKNVVVVSHREYLRTLIPDAIDNLKGNIETKVKGFVTGTTKFGVFAQFNDCLTGLIPAEELDEETRELFNNGQIKPGDSITFWAHDIVSDKKIILSQKGVKENPWEGISEKYRAGLITKGLVVKVAKYGSFIQLEEGISGLLHISKQKGQKLSKGDELMVRINSIDEVEQKIDFSLAAN